MKLKGIKIHGGTAVSTENLCRTCRYCHRFKGHAESQEITYCRATGYDAVMLVRFPVQECTHYDDKRIPALYDLKQIAWTLETKGNRTVGFMSPQQRKKEKIDDGQPY